MFGPQTRKCFLVVGFVVLAYLEPQFIWFVVGTRNFEESVHVSDGRDEVRYETAQGRFEVHLVRFVPSDVLKQVLDLRGNVEMCVVRRIISSGVGCIGENDFVKSLQDNFCIKVLFPAFSKCYVNMVLLMTTHVASQSKTCRKRFVRGKEYDNIHPECKQ